MSPAAWALIDDDVKAGRFKSSSAAIEAAVFKAHDVHRESPAEGGG